MNLSKSSLTPAQSLDCLGMTLQTSPFRAFPTQVRIRKLLSLVEGFSSSRRQPLATWRALLRVMSSMSTLVPGARLRMRSLQLRLNVAGPQTSEDVFVSWDDSCLLDLRWWSVVAHLEVGVPLDLPHPDLLLFTDASDSGWGASLGDDHLDGLWFPVALSFSINHWELLTVLLAVCGFLHLLANQSVALFSDNTTALSYLHKEGVLVPPVSMWPLRPFFAFARHTLCVCSPSLFQALPGPGLRVDSLSGRLPGDVSSLAGHHRSVCDFPEPSTSSLFFPDGGFSLRGQTPCSNPGTIFRCTCFPHSAFFPGPLRGPPLPQPGADVGCSFLASETLVPRSAGAAGGGSDPPTHAEGSTHTTPLSSLPSEPPALQLTGFRIAFCRRSSTRLNYQGKWVTYRGWCRRNGNSISRPTISKIADFHLYLRRSFHPSYSSIAAYCSMLSAFFRFVLPAVSSHPVLPDLLRSFRIERPLPSSRVPPWELLRVLTLLRGPPFEFLSSSSLKDLSARSFSLSHLPPLVALVSIRLYLLVLPFRVGISSIPIFPSSVQSSSPLPTLFHGPFMFARCVTFLALCQMSCYFLLSGLHVYLDHTSSLSPHPRSLFVSPRCPSRLLSKNALSFFLRSVILQSLSSAPSSFPSSSSSGSAAVRAHSIRGVATSAGFSRNASLSSILEAATWRSSSVFTSFYLRDIQFSSANGFSLGSVVAADVVSQ